ncbi:hypothetical protein Q763_09320 [Flavobacterium beibuense F44-8]|uniref:Lipoprotein n=1 Tax=Flavobacterium beibuense F44-8 TaxID=1406840 RepID=A0A0A2LX94_9FLAO|nr:hypothetical protein [Flavobacterium beibuense]KGO80730.1 hypothetical protein Q763_09320 [Flavobacterium beibuense F44-8]
MKKLYILAVTVLIISCKETDRKTTPQKQTVITSIPQKKVKKFNHDSIREQAIKYFTNNKNYYFNTLNNAKGVATVNDNFVFGDTITLLKENGEISSQFIFNDENNIHTFKCISTDSLYYKVEYNNETLYLKKSDKFTFEPWEIHVLKVPFIGFDYSKNSIHEYPNDDSKTISFDPDTFYSPVQLAGKWMQIVWADSNNNNKYGWIKWKENDKLIIELFYFA